MKKAAMPTQPIEIRSLNKPEQHTSKKVKISILLILFIVWTLGIYWFANTYELQNPIILQIRSPFKLRTPPKKQTIISPVVPQSLAALSQPVEIRHITIWKKIRYLESSGGKPTGINKTCRAKGMVNSIGYAPGSDFCFKNEADEQKTLSDWFQDKFEKGYSENEAVCLWNTGVRMDDCAYYQLYQKL